MDGFQRAPTGRRRQTARGLLAASLSQARRGRSTETVRQARRGTFAKGRLFRSGDALGVSGCPLLAGLPLSCRARGRTRPVLNRLPALVFLVELAAGREAHRSCRGRKAEGAG